jgi:D-glycero-alpha-D-manno-heptose-7-phosphate kinase
VAAFREWLRLPLTEYEVAEPFLKIERKDLELAAVAKPNMRLRSADSISLNSVRRGLSSTLCERRHRSSVSSRSAWCGIRGRTSIIDNQIARYRCGDSKPVAAMDSPKALAYDAKRALLSGAVDRFGEVIEAAGKVRAACPPRYPTRS